jgi:ligand-binding sensor domain-containing protein
MRRIVATTIVIACAHAAIGQTARNWETHASLRDVSRGVRADGVIWAASGGSLFSYDLDDSSFNAYYKTDGLNGSIVTALALDDDGYVWAGAEDGKIDRLDPATGAIRTLLDVALSQRSQKGINEIVALGDDAYLATDYGVTVVRRATATFEDTWFKFGSFEPNTPVEALVEYEGRFVVATPLGVAREKSDAGSLADPASWTTDAIANGDFPFGAPVDLAVRQGALIAAADEGIAIYSDSGWTALSEEFRGDPILDLFVEGDDLFFLEGFMTEYDGNLFPRSRLLRYDDAGIDTVVADAPESDEIIGVESGYRLVSKNGVARFGSDGVRTFAYPNGPAANRFRDAAFAPDGSVWFASGKDNGAAGAYRLQNGVWTNYVAADYEEIGSDAFYDVAAGPDGEIAFGNWGDGVYIFKPDGEIVNYDASNSPLSPIVGSESFVVVSSVDYDSRGNLWALSFEAGDQFVLNALTPEGEWFRFKNELKPGVNRYGALTIDQYDTKWFSLTEDDIGVYYFNERGTFADESDDVRGAILESDGLDREATTLEVDRRGDLWIGTEQGVFVVGNLSAALGGYALDPYLVYGLRDQNVAAMAVDPINRKWVGSSYGLTIGTTDGSSTVATFDADNSGLYADAVESIAIDPATGRAYAGTAGGLSTFTTDAVEPAKSFDGLRVYPSPFRPEETERATIEGLVAGSSFKVFNVSGALVAERDTPGGAIGYWDGTDDEGALAPTGVYFIVAFDQEGSRVAVEKIAVVR